MYRFALTVFAAALIVATAIHGQPASPPAEPSPAQEQPVPEPERAALMDEGSVRAMLESRGMDDIRDFDRDGDYYTAVATWFGEETELRIDARTATVVEPAYLSESQIARRLQQIQQFDEVHSVERDGDVYRVLAERGGFQYDLTVDPSTGDVVELQAR